MHRKQEKLLHVEELNEFFEALNAFEGEQVIFASNHPHGGSEAMLLFSIGSFPTQNWWLNHS
jgi:hypothetical protein